MSQELITDESLLNDLQYGNKIAILIGDILIANASKKTSELNDCKVRSLAVPMISWLIGGVRLVAIRSMKVGHTKTERVTLAGPRTHRKRHRKFYEERICGAARFSRKAVPCGVNDQCQLGRQNHPQLW